MRVAVTIELTAKERLKLESFTKGRSSSLRAQERAAIILLAADGLENQEIAASLGQDKMKAGRWRQRYGKGGLAAIPPVPAAVISKIIQLTITSKPAGATQWSRASMAREAGVSESTVGRIWAAHGLKPHQVKTFNLSNDKHFEEKLEDIVGLYLSPPEHAIVLSCDEKSQF